MCVPSPPSDIDLACGFHAELLVGQPFEQLARGGDLVIVFGEQPVFDHDLLVTST